MINCIYIYIFIYLFTHTCTCVPWQSKQKDTTKSDAKLSLYISVKNAVTCKGMETENITYL
jgi:hypothetical protein